MPLTINRWLNWLPSAKWKQQTSYFILPAFAEEHYFNWRGANEIIYQRNYKALNNFIIPTVPPAPVDGEYTPFILCIKYRIGNVVYRYKLYNLNSYNGIVNFKGISDGVYYPFYNGEIIYKNFTLEIWNTGTTTDGLGAFSPSLLNDIVFPMSIRRDREFIITPPTYLGPTNTLLVLENLTLDIPFDKPNAFPAASSGDNNTIVL